MDIQLRVENLEDIIFIKPRSSCFSRYNYVLYNFTSGEAVEAAFISMPRTYHYNKQQITKIDYYNGYIYLNDPNNTVWQVALSDNSYKSWQVGDFIIVGVNNNWRINSYPHILINCSITNGPYCEANLLLY